MKHRLPYLTVNKQDSLEYTFICLAMRGKPDDASNRFAHFPVNSINKLLFPKAMGVLHRMIASN